MGTFEIVQTNQVPQNQTLAICFTPIFYQIITRSWSICAHPAKFSDHKPCECWSLNNLEAATRPKACNFIKKETLAQVFSCEFCEIS